MFYIREVRQKYLYYIYKKKEEMAIMYNNVSASWKKKNLIRYIPKKQSIMHGIS